MQKQPVAIVEQTLIAVFHLTGISTGNPSHKGRDLDPARDSLTGVIPSEITWDTDRGNWAWDGALAALRVMGVDTTQPL